MVDIPAGCTRTGSSSDRRGLSLTSVAPRHILTPFSSLVPLELVADESHWFGFVLLCKSLPVSNTSAPPLPPKPARTQCLNWSIRCRGAVALRWARHASIVLICLETSPSSPILLLIDRPLPRHLLQAVLEPLCRGYRASYIDSVNYLIDCSFCLFLTLTDDFHVYVFVSTPRTETEVLPDICTLNPS